jgi:hypothetical protein
MQTTKSHSRATRVGLALSLLIALVLVAPSCAKRDLRPLNPCTVSATSEQLNILPAEDIDLLFVVDNSGSMAVQQAALRAEIGNIIRTLIDQDRIDQLAEDNPDLIGAKAVKRLRVGTVSSDLGVAGFGQDETVEGLNALGFAEATRRVVITCGATNDGPIIDSVDPERMRRGDRGVINLEPVFADLDGITCPASYPSFLAFDVEGTQSADDFADDVSCTTMLGTDGCGYESQLNSMLAAVTPSDSSTVSFLYGTGVADLPYPEGNAGFLREEALLAIIMITDEDDCSTDNPELFNRDSTTLNDPNAPFLDPGGGAEPFRHRSITRCNFFKEELYPVQRFVDGLLAAKPANRLIFASITGVPNDAVDLDAQYYEGAAAFDAILAHPDMEVRDHIVEGSDPPYWLRVPNNISGDSPALACWRCTNPEDPAGADVEVDDYMECTGADRDLQYAVPADRIVRVARELRARDVITVIDSICTRDFGNAVTNILVNIVRATKPSCLKRELNPDVTGAVPCNFLETLPEGMSCADLEGREETPFKIENGREVCRLIQRIPTEADRAAGRSPEGLGWFYDDYTVQTVGNPDEGIVGDCEEKLREDQEPNPDHVAAIVRFTEGTVPVSGATVRIDCLQPAQAERDINTPCVDDARCRFDDAEGLNAFVVRWNLDASRFSVGGNQPMSCEPLSNTCQIDCQNDADCPGGMVCSANDGNICLDPTCNLR